MVKGVFFDMGDTIVNNLNPSFDHIRDYLYSSILKGLNVNEDDFNIYFNDNILEILNARWVKDNGDARSEKYLEVKFIDLLSKFNNDYKLNLNEDSLQELELNCAYRLCNYVLHKGIFEFFETIRDKYVIVLLSNTCFSRYSIEKILNKLDILKYFNYVFVSSEFGYRKPAKSFFKYALKESGLNYDEVIMFGNSFNFDIKPANELKIKSVLVSMNDEANSENKEKYGNHKRILDFIYDYRDLNNDFNLLVLNKYISKGALDAVNVLKENGYEAYIVGGAVRNALIDKRINDYDITTNALPDDIIRIFEEKDYHAILTGAKHGTITIIKNYKKYEVTTFRSDGKYSDNRHPDNVIFGVDLIDDLRRRDFTINAVCYDGEVIIDKFGGLRDLEAHVVKAVGEAHKRFEEDALRILRALRFACYLGFEIEERTSKAIFDCYKLLENISVERINDEIQKMFNYDCKDIVLKYKDALAYCYNYNIDELLEDEERNELLREKGPSKFTSTMKFALFGPKIESCWREKRLSINLSKEIIAYQSFNNDIDYNEEEFVTELCKYKREQMYYNLIYLSFVYRWKKDKKEKMFGLFEKYRNRPITIRELDINGYQIRNFGYKKREIKACQEEILKRILNFEFENDRDEIIKYLDEHRLNSCDND
ncbi:MAG: HAD hydrolase-like protein [Bacilli bacterium]|nr:HAD hydrolase-like protein [Bacilli bacterium]